MGLTQARASRSIQVLVVRVTPSHGRMCPQVTGQASKYIEAPRFAVSWRMSLEGGSHGC